MNRLILAVVAGFLAITPAAVAQPTFKLSVKPELAPRATLRLEGTRLTHSEVNDDPGFRLQYHIRKDGKTLNVVDARAQTTLDLPTTEPGTYLITLELFHPDFKTGGVQKGGFRPISKAVLYVAWKDAAGQAQVASLDGLRQGLFYGLAAGRMVPVPE